MITAGFGLDECRYCSTLYSVVLLDAARDGWLVHCGACGRDYVIPDREVTGG